MDGHESKKRAWIGLGPGFPGLQLPGWRAKIQALDLVESGRHASLLSVQVGCSACERTRVLGVALVVVGGIPTLAVSAQALS